MALLVWTMVGLALWHFTVFLPDNFYGGIVGAFCGALVGSILFGVIADQPRRIPGAGRHASLTGLEAIPGALPAWAWCGGSACARSATKQPVH